MHPEPPHFPHIFAQHIFPVESATPSNSSHGSCKSISKARLKALRSQIRNRDIHKNALK